MEWNGMDLTLAQGEQGRVLIGRRGRQRQNHKDIVAKWLFARLLILVPATSF